MDKKKEQKPFFRRKKFFDALIFLLIIALVIVILPRQRFSEYTTTHSLTRRYSKKDYERSAQLIRAIRNKDRAKSMELLEKIVNINCPNLPEIDEITDPENWIYPEYPFNIACEYSDYELVKAMLKRGAHIWENTLFGYALHILRDNSVKIVNLLLENGADAKKAELMIKASSMTFWVRDESLAESDVIEIIKLLEQYGGDIYEVNERGSNVVMGAAGANNVSLLTYLIEARNMDVNDTTLNGWTALMSASNNARPEAVAYLLAQGADKTIITTWGGNALDMALDNFSGKVREEEEKTQNVLSAIERDHLESRILAREIGLGYQEVIKLLTEEG